jgi:very-short-patch-repair endonuclease
MTAPEVMLWARLRHRSPQNPVFRRQYPIGPYILDFFCPAAKLAVEIDGHGHGDDAQRAHDARRDRWLGNRGLHVHRITASSVYEHVDEVADGLRLLAQELSGSTS